jgi:phosphoribosylformimino-5-aminoimidazole carboxamide ribotide isomerase
MHFRPCIDLHEGQVKQIVGGTLDTPHLTHNHTSLHPASHFAALYRERGLFGGHVIMLGKGNEAAATSALAAFPGGLQIGGGINADNCLSWLARGASHVIVTSAVFTGKELDMGKLRQLVGVLGGPHRLVLDLSCRRRGGTWYVATDRWQTVTSTEVNEATLRELGEHCAEFLVHAADVEGLQRGIDVELVSLLSRASPVPVTYAGGARSLEDVLLCGPRVACTVGSALDIFGGSGVTLDELCELNSRSSDEREVVKAYYRAMAAHDLEAVLALLDDAVAVSFAGEPARDWSGRDTARQKFRTMFDSGFSTHPPRITQWAGSRVTVDAFFPSSNTRRTMGYTVVGGKIVQIEHQ